MTQAFGDNSQTHLPYPNTFCPTVDEVERRIISVWSELCTASRTNGSFLQELLVAQLHDLGVLRYRAQQRGAE
ncbi:hypothetical protein [Stenotrophomonas sp. PS02289]|uniref:hypothetical protein n=1 Tax=Stenotrophomonas sp. PS02289 TaxID=2991422 RepID=UPI00249A8CA5|nr:hypothetical protein [Stenotrophomonas sp. PS02289]